MAHEKCHHLWELYPAVLNLPLIDSWKGGNQVGEYLAEHKAPFA